MANSKSQRVAAFSLASLFLLTTVATAVFVIWEIRSGDGGIIEQEITQEDITQNQEQPMPEPQDLGIIDNFDGPVEISELRFEVITEGDGQEVASGDTVTIHYTGALATTGEVFDSSVARGEPATFPLDNLIPGWQEGIPGMKVGEKRRLFIPSALGYGEAGAGDNIPPNADLIFDIELFDTQGS